MEGPEQVELAQGRALDALRKSHDASLAVLKIATGKGSRTEARVQTYVSWLVEGLVPRVFEWHVLDRSPQTTTLGMLMEYLHGYEQMDSLDELRPYHLIRIALCGNQPVDRVPNNSSLSHFLAMTRPS